MTDQPFAKRSVILDNTYTLVEYLPQKYSLHSTKTSMLLYMFDRDVLEKIAKGLAWLDNSDLPMFAERTPPPHENRRRSRKS